MLLATSVALSMVALAPSAVGEHSVGVEIHGFAWHDGKLTDLGTLPGGNYSLATAVNQAGDIVGWSGDYNNGGPLHAVLWHEGHITDLGSLGGNSYTAAINDHGVIVGQSTTARTSSDSQAVMWCHGAMTVLPALADSTSGGAGLINDRGDVVGVNMLATGVEHVVLWTGGRILDLGPGRPAGLDEHGRVLVESVDAQGHPYRFVWARGHRLRLPAGVTDIAGLGRDGQVYRGLVAGTTGLDTATVWSVPVR